MDYKETKWKDRIAEGIILYEQKQKMKATGNPYAILSEEPLQISTRMEMASEVYNHLKRMEMINE